jgi:hypothetical protein
MTAYIRASQPESGAASQRMGRHAAILKLIRDYTIEHTRSREIARAALIREGIYTEAGELSPEFGGSEVS